MSPYPADPVRAEGPMRLVLTTYPSREAALSAVDVVLARRLAACANIVPIDSRYWWKGNVESAHESLVLFKTVPKRVGGLLHLLKQSHPYATPEVVELDVPRADESYLQYLATTLDPSTARTPFAKSPTRPAVRRARAAEVPGRTRAPRRRRSR
jgi:periplasmic divalent cation tolerance protein